nr:transposase [Acidocella aminolytica]
MPRRRIGREVLPFPDSGRGRNEKISRTRKRSYGLRRMRWCGLAKASVQVRLTAIAYNLKRTLNLDTHPA